MSLADALLDLAIRAGDAVLEVYGSDFKVAEKPDASPVTDADRKAEAIILEGLARVAPGTPVVAEEQVSAGLVPEIDSRFFLVDPLDGTREFVCRNGEFTVNIALIERGVPVLGVVHLPVQRLAYLGSAAGAEQVDLATGWRGERRAIRVRTAPAELVALASRSHDGDERRWLQHCGIGKVERSGSSLKFCRLAAGEADVYPRFGPTMEWDTAAGDGVLRAAGGTVVDLSGRTIVYGDHRRGFRNPSFLAVGDPTLVGLLSAL